MPTKKTVKKTSGSTKPEEELEDEVDADEVDETEEDDEVAEDFSSINGFQLTDPAKVERVIYGTMGRGGVLEGGLGVDADPKLVLANYDRIGGLIKKDGTKIKTGSFWNFDRNVRAPHKTPKIIYQFNLAGEVVEVDDPTKLAQAVQTMQGALADKEAEFRKKKEASKMKEVVTD